MIHCLNTVVSKNLMLILFSCYSFGKDVLEKTWAWDRLLPLKSSIEWSYYCDYLSHYYKCNASVVAEVTSSLVASAELVSMQLSFLNHHPEPPNFFLLVFLLC